MLVVYRHFLGESHPAAGERPEGVFGGRGERVDGARSESGAAREQAVVGEGVDGFSQDRRGVHDQGLDNQLLQRPPPPVSLAADVQRRERLGGWLNFYHREAA